MNLISPSPNPGRLNPPFAIRLTNFLLDQIFSPIRILLFPFKVITLSIFWIKQAIWAMSNEYSKLSFGSCGKGVRIHGSFHISSPRNLYLGNNVHINSNAYLRSDGGIFIGENTHISRNIVIYSVNHNYYGDLLPYDSGKLNKPVRIGRNVWIGMNVVIAPGVEVGDGAIIGIGSVISKDVPPLAIIGSAPQCILKERDSEHYYRLDAAGKYAGMSGYALNQ